MQTLGQLMYLAHVGCYLPCASCQPLPVLSSLLSKLTVHEDTKNFHKSLFYSEISEVMNILETSNGQNSIWLIDDFAKTTSGINWEALNSAMSQVVKDKASMDKINISNKGNLPLVFMTCHIDREKALDVFGREGTNMYDITEADFKVVHDDQPSDAAFEDSASKAPYLQSIL